VDILRQDLDRPLDAAGWESEKMNRMVFSLQLKITVDNRNGFAGDFSALEQHIQAAGKACARETWMTMNDSWG
jgi:alpha-L-fucosidase